jgi:UDP-N-acetylmuramate dehydrogenase
MIEPQYNVSIAPFTQYRIGGVTREMYFPESADELHAILSRLRSSGADYFILGGGSNVLAGDGFWDGAVVLTTRLDRCEAAQDHIVCGAGLPSSRVAEIARDHSKTGLEFLYLLPGSIGGALAGNARYDSRNVSDALVSLVAVHPGKGVRVFPRSELEFAYKYTSIKPDGWIIAELILAWSDGDPEEIALRMKDIEHARSGGHHFDFPSCGCVFKNDHSRNIQAGRLLDSLGLKGLAEGGARVADYHANFIINTGHATARDVLTLIGRIEQIVRERTGVELEREVQLVGKFE